VHPYLNRRQGKEPVTFPKALDAALGRTLGVPVFQEQCMQIAIIAAGFTPGEADGLRRAMAAWKRKGGLGQYERRLVDGMTERGYSPEFAHSVFEQVKGFSSYGFPESHAASFALLVYASCWIKRHHPAEFLAAMLNSQPLGFYSPSQLVQDAQRHGVEVRQVDVMESDWDCTLEETMGAQPAVRLGLRMVSGLSHAAAGRIVAARVGDNPVHTGEPAVPGRWGGPPGRQTRCGAGGGFFHAEDLARRACLDQQDMRQLAAADALMSLSGHRRQQVWDAAALKAPPALLKEAPVDEDLLELPEAPEGEAIVWDYASLGLTLRRHPLALLRERLQARRFMTAQTLQDAPHGRLVRACGIVTARQQPETANGVVFVTLEDETGVVQVIVWKALRERQRTALTRSRLLAVHGVWQREGEVCNLIAGHLEDLTPLLGRLATESRDFH
jgi:error-prone DNA polymerase